MPGMDAPGAMNKPEIDMKVNELIASKVWM
jgi:hypothetical protein